MSRRTTLSLIALCAALAACGSSPPPPPPAAPTVSATAATAPAAAPPDARDTAVAWVMAVDHAYATGDTRSTVALSHLSTCDECRRIVTEAARIHRPGYRTSGGRLTVFGVDQPHDPGCAKRGTCQAEKTTPHVVITVAVTPLTVTAPNGKRDPASGPAYAQLRLSLNLYRYGGPYGGKWLVYAVSAID